MKILHVITSLQTGGAEKLIVDLLPMIRDLGHDVELAVMNGKESPFMKQLRNSGITLHLLSQGGESVYSPKMLPRLRKIFRKGNYDIIHSHLTAAQLYTSLAAMGLKARLVTTEHNTTNRRRGNKLLELGDRLMYSRYDRIITISDDTHNSMQSYLGKAERLVHINNGIPISQFIHPIRNISNPESCLLTMVAAFRPQKDYETLFNALVKLSQKYRLRVVGDGEQHDYIHNLAKTLGLKQRIEFTGIRTDIPQLLEEADIIIMSSHWEGLSLSSMEGMASGRPVVASDVPGLHDVVDGAGILFPHQDAEALAKAITDLCENPELYQSTAKACQQRAQQYDIDVTARKYNDFYLSLKS